MYISIYLLSGSREEDKFEEHRKGCQPSNQIDQPFIRWHIADIVLLPLRKGLITQGVMTNQYCERGYHRASGRVTPPPPPEADSHVIRIASVDLQHLGAASHDCGGTVVCLNVPLPVNFLRTCTQSKPSHSCDWLC